MRKMILLCSLLSLLTAVGCAENTQNKETESYEIVVAVPTDASETTAPPATESETISTPAPTETASTETTAASSAAESTNTESTETTAESETAPLQTETAETIRVPNGNTDASLFGTWEYEDGYRMCFMDENRAELQMDYAWNISFSEGELHYESAPCEVSVSNNTLTAFQNGEIVLKLTADADIDMEHPDGRYSIDRSCTEYQELAEGLTELPVYYLDVNGESTRLVLEVQYDASNGRLCMMQNGTNVEVVYQIDGDTLTITDDTGAEDVLKRVQ